MASDDNVDEIELVETRVIQRGLSNVSRGHHNDEDDDDDSADDEGRF